MFSNSQGLDLKACAYEVCICVFSRPVKADVSAATMRLAAFSCTPMWHTTLPGPSSTWRVMGT